MLLKTIIGFRVFLQIINDQNMKWHDTSRVKYMHIHLMDKCTYILWGDKVKSYIQSNVF